MWQALWLLALGMGVGILAAILGIGGGLVIVPVLNFLGATPVQATATSLVGVFLGATAATVQNWYSGNLAGGIVIYLALPALLTTELGVRLANILPGRYLLLAFALLLITAIFLLDLKKQISKQEHTPRFVTGAPLIGGIAGMLSGLLGVGGGLVMVPLQMLWLGQNIKDAIRSSLGAITIISLWGVVSHSLKGNVLWEKGFWLGMGTALGGQLGASLLPKLPDRLVTHLFRLFLVIMAIYMVYKAWHM
ncbi:MAG: sulfite exporter TauE/SafE family protein [Pseudanabaenaceae cyanobacterium SKYGB_i_bin29]|nr:sulfite exporter TauE/SafE family protein [Pseudanabaenaceae cyanobacterium SKYG29]MDW8420891.1 sulfite exporter TauE/SafE family protein [Pseudanabaenaceae cyanobacterium SKYGB_i_bin29]